MSTESILKEASEAIAESRLDRRQLLKSVMAGGIGLASGGLLGCGGGGVGSGGGNDADILNFALNLEYLEAEYYLRALTGAGLSPTDAGVGAGAVSGGSQVTFTTPTFQQYGQEIANDELAHVRFLRSALGSAAVPRPAINIGTSFDAAATAAGIGPTFDPYANEVNFLLGAFIFEDVGVTAYKGGAPLIRDKTFLEAAAGILGVEAYHAATVRAALFNIGGDPVIYAQLFSNLRDSVDGADDRDQGVVGVGSVANIVPTDTDGIVYSRSTSQVLSIVYLGGPVGTGGGFFPAGLNGNIR